MAKVDQPEHRLSHYVNTLLERVVVEPCWFTAVETGTIMVKATPEARMQAENRRRSRGIKPAHLDWMLYQAPRYAQIELKIASPVSDNQQATMTALARQGIPSGVCRSVLDVYRFLNAEGFTLHGNAFNVAHEVEQRWRAAQDEVDLRKTKPAKISRARKPRAPKPSPGSGSEGQSSREHPAMKRIYVAGPMSGLPDFNYPAFHAAAEDLRALGYHVENPADNTPPACGTWEGWMRKALAQIITCDAMAMLPGWERSKGAVLEFNVAVALGLDPKPIEQVRP
jgi:hypothetical protein